MHGIASIVTQALPDHLACQVKSCFAQILYFRAKVDPHTDTIIHNTKHEDTPAGVTGLKSLSVVPDSQSMCHTDILKEYPLLLLYSVGSAHQASVFM
jgi:hypothetical protein